MNNNSNNASGFNGTNKNNMSELPINSRQNRKKSFIGRKSPINEIDPSFINSVIPTTKENGSLMNKLNGFNNGSPVTNGPSHNLFPESVSYNFSNHRDHRIYFKEDNRNYNYYSPNPIEKSNYRLNNKHKNFDHHSSITNDLLNHNIEKPINNRQSYKTNSEFFQENSLKSECVNKHNRMKNNYKSNNKSFKNDHTDVLNSTSIDGSSRDRFRSHPPNHSINISENRKNNFKTDKVNNIHLGKKDDKFRNCKSQFKRKPNRKEEIEPEKLDQRESLKWQLSNNKYECMICVANIRFDAATWSCNSCFHIFHVACISKWATTCENAVNKDGIKMNLRCPACQKEYDVNNKELSLYRCFCGKQINPVSRRGQVPHCCDDVCGKSNKSDERCPHLCQLLCHPGPCPSCEAIVTRNCQCGQTRISTKCNADERTLICGSRCNKLLNCGVHTCAELCHAGNCSNCEVVIYQKCWCNRQNERKIICGTEGVSSQFGCGENCERILNCSNHKCDQLCHEGDCKSCQYTPDLVDSCYCGKISVEKLTGKGRQNCLDIIPSCGMSCGKIFDKCGHPCERQCHEGVCEPCPLKRDLLCRCKKSTIMGVECVTLEFNSILCNKLCNKKLSCRRHLCMERCCDAELHLCLQSCDRLLSCKSHKCEHECGHIKACPPCHNVSFDELHCECGSETILPPIACGQSNPICNKLCSRTHNCDHVVRHNCHSAIDCPPCTELTSKHCPGGHKLFDNVPCFRPVVTCGLQCAKPLSDCHHSCNRICHTDNCVTAESNNCTQPCGKIRPDCGHPCTVSCHKEGECSSLMPDCSEPIIAICKCGLRSSVFPCSDIHYFKVNPCTLSDNELEFCTSTEKLLLNCNLICQSAAFMTSRITAISIPKSYNIFSRYYATYFEEFCRNNFNFVISVETIFADLCQAKVNETISNVFHRFSSLTIEKAKFITRLSLLYELSAIVVYNFPMNSAVVTVENVNSVNTIPKKMLSKKVEEKYFQVFKPLF